MLRRYELTDEEWNRIAPLLPPENTGKQGRPRKRRRRTPRRLRKTLNFIKDPAAGGALDFSFRLDAPAGAIRDIWSSLR